jgi:hypothetical protein
MMKPARACRWFIVAAACVAFSGADANVVRWAPDFAWLKSGNNRATLKSLRGQPVVLVVAPSPRYGKFRKQAKELQKT